jgi:hypothetical protein
VATLARADILDWVIAYPDGTRKGGYPTIAAFEYFERSGGKLTKRMREERAELLDAPPPLAGF